MSTLSAATDSHGRKTIASVKGAPETLKGMYSHVPEHYDETYKYFTRRGSRVLALGIKTMDVPSDKVGAESKFTSHRCAYIFKFLAGQ